MDNYSQIPYQQLPSLEENEIDTPELLGAESFELDAHSNLDQFFTRMYRFWHGKGFYNIVLREVMNLVALLFTIFFSACLLLFIDWDAINNNCIKDGTCGLSDVILVSHPFQGHSSSWILWRILYLLFFSLYWMYTLIVFFIDLPGLWDVKRFCNYKLGISERQIQWLSWPELVHRVVRIQRRIRLCVSRDLNEHDIISRIMRKDNYMLGMLNKGVLALNVPIPGFRRRFLLTKTLEWNIYWCIMDNMFNESFQVKEEFKSNVGALKKRFRRMAIANLLLAPFVLIFLVIYFLMKNVEKFYTTPSTIVARSWSPLARWNMREFNEMTHMIDGRLSSSQTASEKYIDQFPNYKLIYFGKLISFIVGSFAALVLLAALLEDSVLEGRQFFGRNLVWWGAVLTVLLRVSRGFIQEQRVFDPDGAMKEVMDHTHYTPRHWNGRAHSKEVQLQFQKLFQYKAQIFLEELASVVLTPFVLYFSLPDCADGILRFVQDFTVHQSGVGDVCSFSTFDSVRHGNWKYASSARAGKYFRSRQGKMEKSCITFVTSYPTWEPNKHVKRMLRNLLPYAFSNQSQMPYGLFGGNGPGLDQMRNSKRRMGDYETEVGQVQHSKQEQGRGTKANNLDSSKSKKSDKHLQKPANIEMCAVQNLQVDKKSDGDVEPSSQKSSPLVSSVQQSRRGRGTSQSGLKTSGSRESVILDEPRSSKFVESTGRTGLEFSFWGSPAINREANPQEKIIESHRILQRFYCDHDETVQHRAVNQSSQLQRGCWMDWVYPMET